MLKAKIGKGVDPVIRKVFPFLFKRPINPNLLTVVGTVICLASAVAFAFDLRAGAIILCLGGLFDLVDGVVARHFGISTRFGAFLDSTLDRWVDAVLLAGVAVYFAKRGEPGHVALAGATTAVMVLVSYSKARAELVLERFEVGLLERAERIVILAAGVLTGYLAAALWVILIGSGITAAQRIGLAYREMQRLDAAESDAEEPRP